MLKSIFATIGVIHGIGAATFLRLGGLSSRGKQVHLTTYEAVIDIMERVEPRFGVELQTGSVRLVSRKTISRTWDECGIVGAITGATPKALRIGDEVMDEHFEGLPVPVGRSGVVN